MNKRIKLIAFIVLFFLVAINIYNFFSRTVNGDESILAEQAKELVNSGNVRSPMFAGMGEGWEYSQLHYHKLFIWTGAVIFRNFGTALYILRSISLFALILLIFVVYKLLKKEDNYQLKFLLFCILLLSNYVFFLQGLIYRPEMLLSSLGICSFYLLKNGIDKNSRKYILFASVCAGLASLTHLNGLSIIFANVIFLLWNKQLKNSIISGITSCLILLFYFIDINTKEKFIQFKTQFFSDPNLEEGTIGILSPLIKVMNEHMRFFHDVGTISFSVLFFLGLIISFKYLKVYHKSILVYFLLLVIGLSAISHGVTTKYAILYYPFMSLIIVYGILYSVQKKSKTINLYIFLIGQYLIINSIYSVNNASTFTNTINRSEYISKYMPRTQSNIFAPEYFFFNQAENYEIRIPLAYTIRNIHYKRGYWTSSDFYNYNDTLNNFYILLDSCYTNKDILKCSNYSNLKLFDTIYNYNVIHVEAGIKLLQKIE